MDNNGQNDTPFYYGQSEFTGGLLDLIIRQIIGAIITVCTLGIMLPWSVVLIKRWEINNTYIDGRRLRFDGTATQLFGNYIKWWILTVITFGIYGLWVRIKMMKWVTKHTHFDS